MFTTFDELRDRASAVISYRVGTVLSSRVSYSRAIVELPFTKFRNAKPAAQLQTKSSTPVSYLIAICLTGPGLSFAIARSPSTSLITTPRFSG